ncbi:MAG: hypothetical protein WCO04_10540 [Pseudomonadota bacterium]
MKLWALSPQKDVNLVAAFDALTAAFGSAMAFALAIKKHKGQSSVLRAARYLTPMTPSKRSAAQSARESGAVNGLRRNIDPF